MRFDVGEVERRFMELPVFVVEVLAVGNFGC